jgi:hypothetical protein
MSNGDASDPVTPEPEEPAKTISIVIAVADATGLARSRVSQLAPPRKDAA